MATMLDTSMPVYFYIIDQARGQDGWILAKFSLMFASFWTESKSRSIETQKEKEANIQPS